MSASSRCLVTLSCPLHCIFRRNIVYIILIDLGVLSMDTSYEVLDIGR